MTEEISNVQYNFYVIKFIILLYGIYLLLNNNINYQTLKYILYLNMLPPLLLELYNTNFKTVIFGLIVLYTFDYILTINDFYIWVIVYNIWDIIFVKNSLNSKSILPALVHTSIPLLYIYIHNNTDLHTTMIEWGRIRSIVLITTMLLYLIEYYKK